jgi:phage terminase small subunit
MKPLTDKQEGFAQAVGSYGKTQSDAYRENYKCDGWTDQAISVEASKIAAKPIVAQRIRELVEAKRSVANTVINFNVQKLLETYFAIAFVDPNELIAVRVGACRHCYGDGHGFQWKEHEYVQALQKWEAEEKARKHSAEPAPMPDIAGGFGYRFTADPCPDCPICEGEGVERVRPMDTTKLSQGAKLLYKGVQQTKDGIKIHFRDQDKALENLGRMLGAFDDKLALNLTGAVKTLALTTSDPAEAARAYQEMLKGN